MSNPVVTVTDSIPIPPDPSQSRRTFTMVSYDQRDFFVYAEGEYGPTGPSGGTFDPTDKGEQISVFVPLVDALSQTKPDFVSQGSWDNTVKRSPSGFVTAQGSVMPKLMIPSKTLVGNGLFSTNGTLAAWVDAEGTIEGFNWDVATFVSSTGPTGVTGTSYVVPFTEVAEYANRGGMEGSEFISVHAKADDAVWSQTELLLNPPPVNGGLAPSGAWSGDLVVGGAFAFLMNIVPMVPGTADWSTTQDNAWEVRMEFGDVTMWMNQVGALKVKMSSASSDETVNTVNLIAGDMSESVPQMKGISEGTAFVVVVYPVWNGIVVQSGIQDTNAAVASTSTYIRKQRAPSILKAPYSTGFDPTNPDEVEVGIGTGVTDVMVDFGANLRLFVRNVRGDFAYLPCYFSKEMWFDEWTVMSDDISGTVDYTYSVYPVWTKNGTSTTLDPAPEITDSGSAGPIADTSYFFVPWRLSQPNHNRVAGAILGSVLEVDETRDFPIKNGNGSFGLSWVGGTPADPVPTGSWHNYIQSVSASVSLDGSSGEVTVDKYGIAGQDAVAIQDIGAIVLTATGGFGTTAGTIFEGLGMGVQETQSPEGASWTIPLVGLEKKLDDIALINVPFFDGETLSTTFRFLTKYAGLIANFSGSPFAATIRLSISEDVNVPRFDWKTGTSVRTALDQVMDDTQHNYVVRDGQIYLYSLDTFGLPDILGPDHEPSYPETKVIMDDRTPDFEVLRNEIVVVGLEQVPDGQDVNLTRIPTFPRIVTRSSTTVPDVPWAKSMVRPISGFLTSAELGDVADALQNETKNYKVIGRTSIPGNATIHPYDRWGGFIIYSVSHSLDLTTKTWTTDLEFSSPAS